LHKSCGTVGANSLPEEVLNPYPGPRPFKPDEYHIFAGREHEISELSSLIVSHRAVALYAQSGAGKTSLLNAGLAPRLKQKGVQLLPVARVGIPVPQTVSIEKIQNVYSFSVIGDLLPEVPDEEPWLRNATLADALARAPRETDEGGEPTLQLIAFDQFEELFSSFPQRWRDRKDFFAQVTEALAKDSLLRVLFVLREDYLATFGEFAGVLPERARTRYHLERLREAEALMAITEPLKGKRWSFAPNVAETLVKDLMAIIVEGVSGPTTVPGEFVEPVQLQVVCFNLFEGIRSTAITQVTMEFLKAYGNADEALQSFYEAALESAITSTGVDEGQLRSWFETNLITPAGTRGLVFQDKETIGGIANNIVGILEAQHLIRPEIRSGSRWYELTHDRFIRPIQKSNQEWKSARWSTSFEAQYNNAIRKAISQTGVSEKALRDFLGSMVTPRGTGLPRVAGSFSRDALAVLVEAGLLRKEGRGNQEVFLPTHEQIAQAIQLANQNWQARNWSGSRSLRQFERRSERWLRAVSRNKRIARAELLNREELRYAEEVLRAARVSDLGVSQSLKGFFEASRKAEQMHALRLLSGTAMILLLVFSAVFAWNLLVRYQWLSLVQFAAVGALGSCVQLIFSTWFVRRSLVPWPGLKFALSRMAFGTILGAAAALVYMPESTSVDAVLAAKIAIALTAGILFSSLFDPLYQSIDSMRSGSSKTTA
jgi:hypothetical protein